MARFGRRMALMELWHMLVPGIYKWVQHDMQVPPELDLLAFRIVRNTRQYLSGSMPSSDIHCMKLRNVSAARETFSGHARGLSRCKSDPEMMRHVHGSKACRSTRLITARSLTSKCMSPVENVCLDKSTPYTWSTFTMFVAGYVRTVSPKFTTWYTT